MTNLNVPPWCRTLIEQSIEAYIFIENDQIAFINEKAKSLVRAFSPDADSCIGREVFWVNNRLNIMMGLTPRRVAVCSNTSDLISDSNEKETITFDSGSVELLYSENTFQLFKLKENPKYPEHILTTDITERKRTEAQFEAYTLQLHELLDTRDKIYSIVAHDLKSSFSSILGLSELLTEDWASIEDSRKQIFARNIFIAADGSYKLLQNLLDWSKNQSGLLEYEPVSFDMSGVINECISLYRIQSLQKNISVQSEILSPTFVYADVNMVQSILRNLISNAIKFTPEIGRVWVTICDAKTDNPEKMVCISVHDNGVGISEERMKKLFDSKINSTTTGTANELGTGLGILICKEMAEKNKGRLWVESEEDKGSTFSFTLPLTKH